MTNAWKIAGSTSKNRVRVEEFCAINFFEVSVLVLFLFQNGTYFPDVPRSIEELIKDEALAQEIRYECRWSS